MGLSILNSGHLTRKAFDKLDSSEKLDLMVKLGELYNMSFIKLQTFERYGQHCQRVCLSQTVVVLCLCLVMRLP